MRKYKRTHVYCQPPEAYEIGRCPKDPNHRITWSEFEDHLWCYECGVDFVPEHWGCFDGPIPMALAREIGMSFDRICIKTRKVVLQPANGASPKERKRYSRTWNQRFIASQLPSREESEAAIKAIDERIAELDAARPKPLGASRAWLKVKRDGYQRRLEELAA